MDDKVSISPDAEVPVTLTVAKWNLVMAIVSEQPYKLVSEIMGEIYGQVRQKASELSVTGSSTFSSYSGSQT